MVLQFIKELLHGVFLSFASIAFWIGFAPILYYVWPSLEGKVNTRLAKIRPYILHIFPWFILISVILTSYSMYADKQEQINKLQNAKSVTKLEIQDFLDFVHPWILKKIDKGQREMHIGLCTSTQIRLIELSKRPDFDKFLSIRKSGKQSSTYKTSVDDDFIQEYGKEENYLEGYYFIIKDALVEKGN